MSGIHSQDMYNHETTPKHSIVSPNSGKMEVPLIQYPEESVVLDPTKSRFQISKEFFFFYASVMTFLTSGGLLLGFGPFYQVMVDEKQWASLCEDQETNEELCADQKVKLQMVFSIGFLCIDGSFTLFGTFCDVFGPKVTILTGLLISALGNFFLAYGNETMLIIGYGAVGIGGMTAYIATLQILQIFKNQGFVYAFVPSLINCSAFVYMLLKVPGITRKDFFFYYGFVCLGFALVSFLLYPYKAIRAPSDCYSIPVLKLRYFEISRPHSVYKEFRQQLKRQDLWFFVATFSWISLVFAFTTGAVPDVLSKLNEDKKKEKQVDLYINYLFPILANGTFIFSSLAGFVIRRYGFRPVFAGAYMGAQLLLGFLLIKNIPAQIGSFLFLSFAQACLYSLHGSYTFVCFAPSVTGSILALTTFISCLTCSLTNALSLLTMNVLNGSYLWTFVILFIPLCGGYFFLWIPAESEEKGKELALKYSLQNVVDKNQEEHIEEEVQ